MPPPPWSDDENDLTVKDYFEMLQLQLAGKKFTKAQRHDALVPKLKACRDDAYVRPIGAIWRKHQNISAILQKMEEAWIDGYKPLSKYQKSLEVAVSRWLDNNGDRFFRKPDDKDHMKAILDGKVSYDPPPLKHPKSAGGSASTSQQVRKIDFTEQNERNKMLGKAGEKFVLELEKNILRSAGHDDLASKVRWVSDQDGDGFGYDILSFNFDGSKRLIEVKTTKGGKSEPFYISSNELLVSREQPEEWVLVRVWGFQRSCPSLFELKPPLEDHVTLTPSEFKASFTA